MYNQRKKIVASQLPVFRSQNTIAGKRHKSTKNVMPAHLRSKTLKYKETTTAMAKKKLSFNPFMESKRKGSSGVTSQVDEEESSLKTDSKMEKSEKVRTEKKKKEGAESESDTE